MWYPENKKELEKELDKFLNQNIKKTPKEVHGLIVPHAGYEFSGAIAGKAFSLLKEKKINKAIVLGPSHYSYLSDIVTTNSPHIHLSIGEIKFFNTNFPAQDISQEHSITNQYPFLQKIGISKVMPLMIGEITNDKAKEVAEKISKEKSVYIFSTDLSHFLPYNSAIKTDKKTIKIIKDLDLKKFNEINACGKFPLLIMMHLCRINKWKPRLIEYKNSGDVTGEKSSVVGYASFCF